MRPQEFVASSAEPAFVVDGRGRILAWNDACGQLLGYRAEAVLGRCCCDVVCGRDIFGNRYCVAACAARDMARRGEAAREFPLDLRRREGGVVRVVLSLLRLEAPGHTPPVLAHLLHPEPTRGTGRDTAEPAAGAASPAGLTPRELEVLRLLSRGADPRRVAAELFISLATTRTHIQHILAKLGAHSQAQAVAFALRRGLV